MQMTECQHYSDQAKDSVQPRAAVCETCGLEGPLRMCMTCGFVGLTPPPGADTFRSLRAAEVAESGNRDWGPLGKP